MCEYPQFLLNIFENINDTNYCNNFYYDLTANLFDKRHHFNRLMNYFQLYFQERVIECSSGYYFIMKKSSNSYLLAIIITVNDTERLYIYLSNSIDQLKNKHIFNLIEDNEYNNKYNCIEVASNP